MEMKQTPLHGTHVKLGAKMHEFAGYDMPIQYKSIIDEHKCVRTAVGVFDVSHMGEFFIEGEDALELLQMMVPQELSTLDDNQIVYCQLTNKDGGILDDLLIYKYNDEKYFTVVNASRVKEDFEWMQKNLENGRFKAKLTNISDDYALLALQGPKSSQVLLELGLDTENSLKYYTFGEFQILNHDVMISRTGYTGEDGFEIMIKNEFAVELWNELFKKGEKYGIMPVGLGARDTLRLEAGMLLYGQDMDETKTPVEASLSWSVSKTKTHSYNGKDVIKAQLIEKPQRRLMAFVMTERAIARHGYEIYDKNNNIVGIVTSGGISPTLGENIGLGYIDNSFRLDDNIMVKVRDKFYEARIVKKPFVEKVNKIVK